MDLPRTENGDMWRRERFRGKHLEKRRGRVENLKILPGTWYYCNTCTSYSSSIRYSCTNTTCSRLLYPTSYARTWCCVPCAVVVAVGTREYDARAGGRVDMTATVCTVRIVYGGISKKKSARIVYGGISEKVSVKVSNKLRICFRSDFLPSS